MLYELDKIRTRRKALDLTQSQLSKEASVSQSTLHKIEKKDRKPSYDKAKRIFEALDRIGSQDEEKAKDKMSSPVDSVSPNDKISKARKIMKKKNFSQLPVVGDGFVVGGLTERDIALKEHQDEDAVSSIMGEEFPTVKEETSLSAVKALLRENQAVLIKKKKKIIGIINWADFL